jgi:hypothetical protein
MRSRHFTAREGLSGPSIATNPSGVTTQVTVGYQAASTKTFPFSVITSLALFRKMARRAGPPVSPFQ